MRFALFLFLEKMKHFAPVVVPRKSQPADGTSASVVATFDFETLVAETPGQCYLEFVDGYVISIRDVELIKDDAAVTDDDITAMEQVQGKYWKVGEVDSLPVFRQEADGGGSKEFFLCRLADGWFITSSLVSVVVAVAVAQAVAQAAVVGGGGTGGGWLNKCKKLMGLVEDGKWDEATGFAKELSMPPTMVMINKGGEEKKRRREW